MEERVPWGCRGKFGDRNEPHLLVGIGQHQGRWFVPNASKLHQRANGAKIISQGRGMMLRWDLRGDQLFRPWLDRQSQHT